MNKYFSIIVPAFNEAKEIASTINFLVEILGSTGIEYEILVFNDGSTDKTGEIADQLAELNENVRVIHHFKNRGIGASTQEAIKMAKGDCISWFPGDGGITRDSFRDIILFAKSMKEDILIAYMKNNKGRSFSRRIISSLYTIILNMLFGLNLKYYNGPSVLPLEKVRNLNLQASRHDSFAEIIILSIKTGCSYCQFSFDQKLGTDKVSKAISLKNIFNITKTVFILMKKAYLNA